MRDIVAKARAFATDIAYRCHGRTPWVSSISISFINAGARLAGEAPEAPIDPDIRPIYAVIRENEAWQIWR